MKPLVAVSLFFLVTSADGRTVTFKNQCNNDVFVALRHEKSGGSDGLGDSGSWHIDVTEGWWNIPPQREIQLVVGEAAYAIVVSNGVIVSAVQEDQEREVKPFCFSRERFKYEIWTRGRKPDGKWIDPKGDCSRAGGEVAPFEWLGNKKRGEYGTYIIYANQSGKQPPAPTLIQWQGINRAFRYNPTEGKWDEFDTDSNTRIHQFEERGRDNVGAVVLYDPSRSLWVVLNSKAALFRKDDNGGNFTKFLDGGWLK